MRERLVARYKLAGFIPDKFWTQKRSELKNLLEASMDAPHDVVWGINDTLKPFFGLFRDELLRYNLNDFAEDSVNFRIDMLFNGQLSGIADKFSKLDKELNSSPYPRTEPVDEIQGAIESEVGEFFKKQLPTLGKALKTVWGVQPGSVRALAEKLVRKATPAELQAIRQTMAEDYSTPVLNAKYGFYNRVNLEGLARKLITKDKIERDYLKWFEQLKATLLANYGTEGLDTSEGFTDFAIGNLKVIVSAPDIGVHTAKNYAARFVEAQRALQQKGFSKVWYGAVLVTSTENYVLSEHEKERYKELGYQTLESQAGVYHSGADVVKLTAPPTDRLVRTIVHEMGHRYWFKFMKPEQRARFNGLVKTNPSTKTRDYPSGPDEDGVEKPVAPVSDYGKSSIEEAFAEAFQHYVMGEDMTREQGVSLRSVLASSLVTRYKAAKAEIVNEAWVERLRRDFLTLMKNLPRVKNYDTAVELRTAFSFYRNRFREFFFDQFLNKQKAEGNGRFEGIRKPAWDFYANLDFPLQVPNADVSEEMVWTRYQAAVKAWEARLKRSAQTFWKAVRDTLETQVNQQVEVETPNQDRLVIEGFQADLVGYDPEQEDWQIDALAKFREALRQYRRKAAQRMPWLLQKQLPLVLDFRGKLGEGGRYEGRHIVISIMSMTGNPIEWGSHVMAHEMGHHLFKSLSGPAREFWETAVLQDYGPLDVDVLLDQWPENLRWSSDFVSYMAMKDPVLALQVDVLSGESGGSGKSLMERKDFEALLSPTIPVPKSPITGYAGKNPEEAFCEAIGNYVGEGPMTVLPVVRGWLNITIPGMVKTAFSRLVDRYKASAFRQ